MLSIPPDCPIRNFSIIAHIDHGKSTLADCLIRYCHGLSEREMKAQVLDNMDLERERGITIKAQTASLIYHDSHAKSHVFNLIDTPGHIDFSYEVSRSLSACEGCLLVVDASQGVEAQTIANCYKADKLRLPIIPVINKIDLPAADVDKCKQSIEEMIGIDATDAVLVSAKEMQGIDTLFLAMINHLPIARRDDNELLQALVVDCWFDTYVGVVILIRIFKGIIRQGDKVRFVNGKLDRTCDTVGIFTPRPQPVQELGAGCLGYVITGQKNVREVRVGDTITHQKAPCINPLPGFQESKPQVYVSFYPIDGADYPLLRDAAEKLQINDAAFSFQPEVSPALGHGLRCGFLGLLHMEVVQERLEREYSVELIATGPGVSYQLIMQNGETTYIDHPGQLPDPSKIRQINEPIAKLQIVCPKDAVGKLLNQVIEARGCQTAMHYAGSQTFITADVPLAEVIGGYFDELQSISHGLASMDYDFYEYRQADIARLDILINGDPIEASASMVPKILAQKRGRELCALIKEKIPRQMFDISIQAAIGGKILARETVKAKRKDVLAKCYGGDITRKKKLLEKQKKGKKRMKMLGNIEIPQEAFLALNSKHKK